MNHWLLDSIEDKRREALLMADKAELCREIRANTGLGKPDNPAIAERFCAIKNNY
jgi:hypothetical protein